MHLPWPERQHPASPPVILRKIDTALLRPAPQLPDQARLATAWRPGDKDLAKSYTPGDGDALDPVNLFKLDTIQ